MRLNILALVKEPSVFMSEPQWRMWLHPDTQSHPVRLANYLLYAPSAHESRSAASNAYAMAYVVMWLTTPMRMQDRRAEKGNGRRFAVTASWFVQERQAWPSHKCSEIEAICWSRSRLWAGPNYPAALPGRARIRGRGKAVSWEIQVWSNARERAWTYCLTLCKLLWAVKSC